MQMNFLGVLQFSVFILYPANLEIKAQSEPVALRGSPVAQNDWNPFKIFPFDCQIPFSLLTPVQISVTPCNDCAFSVY